MQIGDMSSNAHADDVKSQRGLRKSSRLHDTRSGPTSNPRTKEEDPPSPTTTSSSGFRKKLSSLHEVVNGESATESNIAAESRSPKGATSNSSSVDRSPQVCLCQPEPKIPRPRNAFILYRQHHQQAIIARNPGLNNPDISKIIGEQWKAESEESKRVWQDLAQEEKARHQELYPDYRYQPRRCGKSGPGSVTSQHTAVDKYRCPRCGGRSIKTPSSPFLDSSGTPTLPPPNYSEGGTPTTRYLPVMNNLSLESPVRRRGHGPSSLSNIQVPPLREENAVNSPGTPGFKKRRFDYGPPSATSVRRPEGPYYPQHARRDSLPPIHVQYSPPNSATMQPPRTPHDARRPVVQPEAGVVHAAHAEQSPKSVEEVLMTFPYQNKIKLLGRISLPYKDPAPMPGSHRVRGAIIAVEGDDTVAVKELTEWLNERLIKDTEVTYHPRIVDPPCAPDERGATFEGYLDLIREWHGRSKDMISYITASSASPMLAQHPLPIDRHTPPKHSLAQERKDSASESATPPTPPPVDPAGPATPRGPQATPIILLPTFQLTASIAYASRIPIQDAYSTTDHWQWMATLWRGTIGPDLTIYVKSYEREQGGQKPELDDAVRCLTVWKERESRFSDTDLRRVMFEVGEFVAGLVGALET